MTRCVVWQKRNRGKAAQRVEKFLFLPASCQFLENRACSFPLSLLQRKVYFVSAEGKKRTFVSISYFRGDVLTFKEEEVTSFYEDYAASSGTAHNEGDLQICC